MKHYQIRVHGKVQGVFFRASTLREAVGLGLKGWVKNQPDGTVLIAAEGDPQSLDQLLAWCQYGPEFANVSKVDWQENQLSNFESFRIVR